MAYTRTKNCVRACTLCMHGSNFDLLPVYFRSASGPSVFLNNFLRLIVDDVYVRKTIRARSSDQNEAEMNESNFDQY